ncbi:MAG TPA: hypothetical protein DIC52_25730 [Candidatus Latescibacteria bacterium]|nr:hypothetical protein [Candidatus Latescibacterota bacterium]|tara:strand:- start:6858 stop:7328 length:471 start_codon:yes stop_codon:yes gene_type:complete
MLTFNGVWEQFATTHRTLPTSSPSAGDSLNVLAARVAGLLEGSMLWRVALDGNRTLLGPLITSTQDILGRTMPSLAAVARSEAGIGGESSATTFHERLAHLIVKSVRLSTRKRCTENFGEGLAARLMIDERPPFGTIYASGQEFSKVLYGADASGR